MEDEWRSSAIFHHGVFYHSQPWPLLSITGILEDKWDVLSCLGSNLFLTGKQLRLQADRSLALFQKVAPEIQSLHNRLEPAQVGDSTTDWGV